MIKTRVIGVVLVKGNLAVQSIGFQRYLPLGAPEIAVSFLDRWGIDEIVVLHLDGNFSEISRYADRCRVPLAVGGGLRTIDDIKAVIHAGADKVVLNHALVYNPTLAQEAACLFGSQSVIASIDAKRDSSGRFVAFTNSGSRDTGVSAAELAKTSQNLGVGEILITSIDRDGARSGYDLDLLDSVRSAVTVPVIACGGAGNSVHMAKALETGIAAVAAGNFFHYTEHSVILVKRELVSRGLPIRLDTYVTYEKFNPDNTGRLAKYSDDELEALRFRYLPEERI